MITYDIWIFTLFAFVRTISYRNWFVYVELYYLQLFTSIAYLFNAHIMLLRYVMCNYIWCMGSQNYELLSKFTMCSFLLYSEWGEYTETYLFSGKRTFLYHLFTGLYETKRCVMEYVTVYLKNTFHSIQIWFELQCIFWENVHSLQYSVK